VRISKKGEVREWTNQKGTGSLLALEFVDIRGTKMQATLFKELVQLHQNTF
jgi:ssDNA-binding replication factor A large subunit